MSRWRARFLLWLVETLTQRLVRTAEQTTDPVLLAMLSEERNAEIETAVSLNPATDSDTLHKLLDRARRMAGSDEEWREHILHNPGSPVEMLRDVMREDTSEAVRVRAACLLSERLSKVSRPDPELIAECGNFLADVEARSDYPGVKMALSALRSGVPGSGVAS